MLIRDERLAVIVLKNRWFSGDVGAAPYRASRGHWRTNTPV